MENLDGIKIYVSGTSKGIGHEITREALEHGAHVVGTSYHTPAEVVRDSFAEFGDAYHHLQHDAADYRNAGSHLQAVRKALSGHADFNVFNAAEIAAVGPMLSATDVGQTYERLFAVNVAGPVALVRGQLRQAGPGHKVVNVFFGTVGAFEGAGWELSYFHSFDAWRDIPHQPVGPCPSRRIRIIHHQSERLRFFWHVTPLQWRRKILSLIGIRTRNFGFTFKS